MNADTIQGGQLLLHVRDQGEDLGYLAIDSMVGGRAHGGLRLQPEVTVVDICMLAHTMTLKYGFLGLPFGGAKAGVIGDPEAPAEERRRALARFAAAIRPLMAAEIFVPAADMGTATEDIRWMLQSQGFRLEKRRLPAVSSGEFTAHSVKAAALTLADHIGLEARTMTVAIEGFGSVGSRLAGLLAADGARIVAISTSQGALYNSAGLDVERLTQEAGKLGSAVGRETGYGENLDREDLLTLPVDLLCQCARMHSIDRENVDQVRARILCPGANNPWPPEVEREFGRAGRLFLPEFAANSGGILGTVMAYATFDHEAIAAFVEDHFRRSTRWIIEQAERRGVSSRQVAEEVVARRRWKSAAAGRRSIPSQLVSIGLALHRRGLVPGFLLRPYARRYLASRLRVGMS